MNTMLSIARYTFVENMRNKIFHALILFGAIMLASSLLLSALGGEQSLRILLDLGCGAIEFFALLGVCFSAVTLVLEEMESKTIYLILTRPVSRTQYLLGRFSGLLMAVYAGMLAMAGMHLLLLLLKGWGFQGRYLIALLLSAEKIMVIGSVALFFSLFSSSALSSVSFTVFFWVLGHFSGEMNYLGSKIPGLVGKVFIGAFYYLIPNMQYFNLRDFWDMPQVLGRWLFLSAGYGVLYSAVFILCTSFLLRKKEF